MGVGRLMKGTSKGCGSTGDGIVGMKCTRKGSGSCGNGVT